MTFQTALSGGLLLLAIAYLVVFVFLVFVLEPPRAGVWILPTMALLSGISAGGISATIATGEDFFFPETFWRLSFVVVQLVFLWIFNLSIGAWVIREVNAANRRNNGKRRRRRERQNRADDERYRNG